jgi:hypothetical protein
MDKSIMIFAELPMFVALGGERMAYYDIAEEVCGSVWPFAGGIAITRHEDVSHRLNHEQRKGRYIGARSMADECMGDTSLIFQSNGEFHTKIRSLLHSSLKAFDVDSVIIIPEAIRSIPKEQITSTEVTEALVSTMYFRLFGEFPGEVVLIHLREYLSVGPLCVLDPMIHTLAAGMVTSRVKSIREAVFQAAWETRGGLSLRNHAALMAFSEAETAQLVQQLVDGFLFAGLLGTNHLTVRALHRLQTQPALVDQWDADPFAFLLEQARVDPPVTSVTVVLDQEETVLLGKHKHVPVTVFPGTTAQLIISSANKDRRVFGGEAKSKLRARAFDAKRSRSELNQLLSWNGLESRVVARTAPRGCLGHDLALDIARKLVDHFKPADPTHMGSLSAGNASMSSSSHMHRQQAALLSPEVDSDVAGFKFHIHNSLERLGYTHEI